MLKNLKPISLILLAGALSYPVASHAGITPGQPNVDFFPTERENHWYSRR